MELHLVAYPYDRALGGVRVMAVDERGHKWAALCYSRDVVRQRWVAEVVVTGHQNLSLDEARGLARALNELVVLGNRVEYRHATVADLVATYGRDEEEVIETSPRRGAVVGNRDPQSKLVFSDGDECQAKGLYREVLLD